MQLEKEASRRSQLEKVNGELKDQLASLKSLSRSNDQLERSKRQLEEELMDLRRRMEVSQMEQSQMEQYRRETDERARQEVQQKLEQVNLFLQVKNFLFDVDKNAQNFSELICEYTAFFQTYLVQCTGKKTKRKES